MRKNELVNDLYFEQIFRSYNVLGAEKVAVYTAINPTTDVYDVITIGIPENLVAFCGETGDTGIVYAGYAYSLNDCLVNRNEDPAIRVFDRNGNEVIIPVVVR